MKNILAIIGIFAFLVGIFGVSSIVVPNDVFAQAEEMSSIDEDATWIEGLYTTEESEEITVEETEDVPMGEETEEIPIGEETEEIPIVEEVD